MNVVGRLDIAHIPLQSRLPADVEVAELLRGADVAGASELGRDQAHIAARVLKCTRRPESAAREPVISPEDRECFDAVAERAANLSLLIGGDLAADGMWIQGQEKSERG